MSKILICNECGHRYVVNETNNIPRDDATGRRKMDKVRAKGKFDQIRDHKPSEPHPGVYVKNKDKINYTNDHVDKTGGISGTGKQTRIGRLLRHSRSAVE